jgi:DsbC/DsbD-like thiol-disulfide interchange protein
MKKLVLCVLTLGLIALAPSTLVAQKKPGEAVKVLETKIKGTPAPGAEVTAVVAFEIDPGYHTHSNKPSEKNFIATVLTVQPAHGVNAGEAVYPKGKTQKVAGLDKPLSVFEGQFTISVPLKLDSSAKLPLTVPASLRYQACQGAVCYPPKSLKVEIPLGAQ